MSAQYPGESPIAATDAASYSQSEWALWFIAQYGQIDGDHHKAWVLDQVARVLHGTPVVVMLARWDDGTTEYRVRTGKPSKEYEGWLEDMRAGGYGYDEGVAP